MTAPLTLFNSLSRSLERFIPIEPGTARVYSCGPTVYDFAHLGNLRAYVFTDTLHRVLEWKGYAVTHVINITDVGHLTSDAEAGDDKMELAAHRAGKTIWDIAAFYTAAFKADVKALNILDPTRWSTATDHIADMIAFAAEIEAHGAAYRLAGGLYFDITKVPDYGRLARAATIADEDEAVGRIAGVEGKRHPADFALWRTSPEGEKRQMEWPSPWGVGAPGWHLECSVMSIKYLGRQFDIHTGGIDHREIHHPNEIAQNQAYNCSAETGANTWMHNNFLVDRDGKMSKSKGGITTLQSLVDRGVHPLAYRLLCLSSHYRSELEFSGDALVAALTRLKRLVKNFWLLRQELSPIDWLDSWDRTRVSPPIERRRWLEDQLGPFRVELLERFDQAISADLSTPQGLPLLEEALADKKLPAEDRLRLATCMDLVLGFDLHQLSMPDFSIRPTDASVSTEQVQNLITVRQEARSRKDFAASDAIRDELQAGGVEVMDGASLGWEWAVRLD